MATEKWIAGSGQGLTWGGANTSASLFNALANGSSLASDLAIDNSVSLDVFCDISWTAGGTSTTAAPNYLGFYLYPLGQNGATYGDGRFSGTAGASVPPSNYLIGTMGFAAASATTIAGVVKGIILPPGLFKFVVYNASGVALAGSNIFKYRTYNRAIA